LRQPLTERYRERLAGVLSCYDRVIVTATLPGACYAKGMTGFLSARQIRILVFVASASDGCCRSAVETARPCRRGDRVSETDLLTHMIGGKNALDGRTRHPDVPYWGRSWGKGPWLTRYAWY
jgi:hypothetical protein